MALLVLGCGESPRSAEHAAPSPPPAAREVRPLEALFVGCQQVHAGPQCVVEPGATLRVWAEVDPGLGPTLTIDGAQTKATPEPVEGGVRWVVVPPAGARRLQIEADLDGAIGRFSLELAQAGPRGVYDLVSAQLQAAAEATDEGNLEGAALAYEEAWRIARARGRTREASTIAQLHVHMDLELRYDVLEAQRWLERDAALVEHDPEQQMMHAYYRGLLAEHLGDPRAALEAYDGCAHQARAVGLTRLEAAALTQQMVLVGTLGAWERAQALKRRVLSLGPTLDPLQRAQLLNLVAWMLLEVRGRGRSVGDPVPLLRRALEEIEGYEDPTSARLRQTIPLGLALAAVLDGQAAEARRWLDAVEGATLHHEDRLWQTLLLARVAGLEGDPSLARQRFEALLLEADRLREPELRWHALLGRGQAEDAAGLTEAAVRSYTEAERALDTQLPRLAMGEGRASFVAERDRSARRLVDLLLRLERPREALCAARLARSRALRTIARQLRSMAAASPVQRQALARYRESRSKLEAAYDDSWSLPAASARQQQRRLERQRSEDQRALDRLLDELHPDDDAVARCEDLRVPAPGVLELHFMQLDDGWVGFGLQVDGLLVERLGSLTLDGDGRQAWAGWSAALLDPFAEAIGRAERIRVIPTGELLRVPFHALPVPGSPARMLIDQGPVSYGLDLPGRVDARGEASGRVAMLVAPPSNLRHAPDEVEAVARLLRDAGYEVRRLEGEQAVGDAVRRALPQVDLAHYVGHARSDDLGGWSSALSLARDSSLDVTDVLTLPGVPRTVVLNGCETGRTDPQALAGGMSMAHAFVLARSALVVATDQEIDDAAAAGLIRAFHQAHAAGQPAVEALQTALRQRRELDDGWVHTRGWVP